MTTKITLAIAGSIFLATATQVTGVSAATSIGGVNMQDACYNQHRGTDAVVTGTDVMSWKCRTVSLGQIVLLPIDVDKQCVHQYGRPAYGAYTDFQNPYSWYCHR